MDESHEDTLDAQVSETEAGGAAAAGAVASNETGPASRVESGSPDPTSTPVKPEVVTVVPSAHASEPSAVSESPTTLPHPHSVHGPATTALSSVQQVSGNPTILTLNQLAIVNASQNKLPCNDGKGLVKRLTRHTLSSASKLGPWYKGDTYVDCSFYSWRNLELFSDHQKQMYTPAGAIKGTYRK